MTDIACMSNVKNNDDNQDITRKIKRMKLNNSSSPFPHNQSNFQLPCFNLKNDCSPQNLFPYLKEDIIQETIRKSLNTPDAINKLHQLNSQNFLLNKSFSSLHKSNKKRRFGNIESYNNFGYPSNYIEEEAKIVESRPKNLMNQTQLDDFVDREAEEIIRKFRESKSLDEAKSYLAEKLVKFSNQTLCNNEINIQLDNLIEDNKKLKKAILLFDKKWEQNRSINKEIETLKQEYEGLRRIHSNQIQNNNILEYILKQNEN